MGARIVWGLVLVSGLTLAIGCDSDDGGKQGGTDAGDDSGTGGQDAGMDASTPAPDAGKDGGTPDAGVTDSGADASDDDAGTLDVDAPAPVTLLDAVAGPGEIDLQWKLPGDADLDGIRVVYLQGSDKPTGPDDGTVVDLPKGASGHRLSGLADLTQYQFAVYAFDRRDNYSVPAHTEATTPDSTPPGPVTGFGAAPIHEGAILYWTPPLDADYGGTELRYASGDTAPPVATEGTLSTFGDLSSYVQMSLTNSSTYAFSAFAYDDAQLPNYATPETAVVVPVTSPDLDKDQECGNGNYGYRLNNTTGFVQTFKPAPLADLDAHPVFARLDLRISKIGTPAADVQITVRDTVTSLDVWSVTVAQADIPSGSNWLVLSAVVGQDDGDIPYTLPVLDREYEIRLLTTATTPAGDYYSWNSSPMNTDCYDRGEGRSGAGTPLSGNDFAFITWRIAK